MTLIERLEQATGPDRELDALIACAFPQTLRIEQVEDCHGFRPSSAGTIYYNRAGSRALMSTSGADIHPFTASLDAALALVEGKLPGWKRGLAEQDSGQWCASLWRPQPGGHPSALAFAEDAPTPALAVLIALLKSLGDQHD